MSTVGPVALLPALLVIYAVPYLVWRLARTDRVAPLVVVQIVAGLLLGPGVLGKVAPGWYAAVFSTGTLDAIGAIATLAVVLFIWTAGVELDLADVRAHARETGVAAGLAVAGPLVCGSAAALFLLQRPGWIGAHGQPWQAALGIGMACSVTALPILVLMMDAMGILRTPLGRRAMRIASLDDILLWSVLAIVLLDRLRLERQVGFLVVLAALAPLMRMGFRRLPPRDRWPAAMIWLFACAWAADWAGLHYMVGAFVAGLSLDRRWFDEAELDGFRNVVLLVLMPVFFLNTGLRTDWTSGGGTIVAAAALLLAAAVGGKIAGVGLASRLLGWERGQAILIGLLLQTKALVMILFSRVLVDRGIISTATFAALLLMAIASTALTTPATLIVNLRRRTKPGAPSA